MVNARECRSCCESSLPGIAFCRDCKKAMIGEMEEVGYLHRVSSPGFHKGMTRTQEQRQGMSEDADANGCWSNAVRALEDTG